MKKLGTNTLPLGFFLLVLLSSILPSITADTSEGNDYDINSNDINPSNIRQISLVILNDIGTITMEVNLLRPLWWIEAVGAEVNGTIRLTIAEKGIIDEIAYVQSIDPCPEISCDDGNLVTGTFRSFGRTVEMRFSESDEVIECTHGHRFYSEDQGDWIPAQDLYIDEKILTKDGYVTIATLVFHDEVKEVFNLEIMDDDHSYFVSQSDVLAHNSYSTSSGNIPSYWFRAPPDEKAARLVHEAADILGIENLDDYVDEIFYVTPKMIRDLNLPIPRTAKGAFLIDPRGKAPGVYKALVINQPALRSYDFGIATATHELVHAMEWQHLLRKTKGDTDAAFALKRRIEGSDPISQSLEIRSHLNIYRTSFNAIQRQRPGLMSPYTIRFIQQRIDKYSSNYQWVREYWKIQGRRPPVWRSEGIRIELR
jgi:hypothetical protein